jgi:hypothetical protein
MTRSNRWTGPCAEQRSSRCQKPPWVPRRWWPRRAACALLPRRTALDQDRSDCRTGGVADGVGQRRVGGLQRANEPTQADEDHQQPGAVLGSPHPPPPARPPRTPAQRAPRERSSTATTAGRLRGPGRHCPRQRAGRGSRQRGAHGRSWGMLRLHRPTPARAGADARQGAYCRPAATPLAEPGALPRCLSWLAVGGSSRARAPCAQA